MTKKKRNPKVNMLWEAIFTCHGHSSCGSCILSSQTHFTRTDRYKLRIARLTDPLLKQFLEKRLGEIRPWPPEFWDFAMRRLVALYYHPDLEVAKARWGRN